MTDLSVAYGGPKDPLDNLLKTEGFTAESDKGAKENKDQMKKVDNMDTSGRLTVGGAKKKKKTSKKKTAKKKTAKKKTKKAKKSKRKTMKKKAKKSKK
tara:strand:- start:70 stop:363 length:294 start_codon:yes stop_codon:yes gene_type:complete